MTHAACGRQALGRRAPPVRRVDTRWRARGRAGGRYRDVHAARSKVCGADGAACIGVDSDVATNRGDRACAPFRDQDQRLSVFEYLTDKI
eukprot:COSAG05_NODE_74_length_21769_cov_194.316290_15_plen_90_part_00